MALVHEKETLKYFTRVSGERCVPTPPISTTLMQETFALRSVSGTNFFNVIS